MKKPTFFRYVILPCFIISPAVVFVFFIIVYKLMLDNIKFAVIITTVATILINLLITPFFYIELKQDYKNRLHKWKYHQITWEEYMQEKEYGKRR